MNIVFMGTPAFAVESLAHICRSSHSVCGVVTAPDKPAGRGQKIRASEVKEYAIKHGLPLLQPRDLTENTFIKALKEWNPDVIVVVAFRKLPEEVWQLPRHGTFNLHASLLPHYRGAAPINRAIMNGEKETGLTTFFIDKAIDTGRIILQKPMPIVEDETAGELHDRMMKEGALLVMETLDLIAAGHANSIAQPQPIGVTLKSAPKIFKEETYIDWGKPAGEIHNMIRGLSPYPAATALFSHPSKGEISIRVYRSSLLPAREGTTYPALESDGKTYVRILLPDGVIELLDIQLQGRKRMKTGEFLRGFPLHDGWKPLKHALNSPPKPA